MSPERRCHQHPAPAQKRPTVMTAALHAWLTMTNLAHQGPLDSRFPCHSPNPPQSLPPQETPAQHPHSRPMPLSAGHINQQCVHHYRDPRKPHKHRTMRDLGSVAVAHGSGDRGTGIAVRQGEDRPREPTLHEALLNIMGAYHHSQETMSTVLAKLQETQQLQEGQ
ncbi:hypothetical protein NDU88_001802 [Pleurodeles waltl]|uniref:Uncharacterized protein n=1 Tax=Pleurodeles waltl TaxID=8319 RepID=A0AAV7WMM9_PLEWA|nr:hypothetical protein NDU88_001802 [Pleurodeles waltl]